MFDRSWYGRGLVERVEGIANKREWLRGYEEINQFEQMLVADGIRIVKCFLHITPEEQIRRFKDRLANPWKRWKLTLRIAKPVSLGRLPGRHGRHDRRDLQGRFLGTLFRLITSHMGVSPSSDIHRSPGRRTKLEPRPADPKIAEAAAKLLKAHSCRFYAWRQALADTPSFALSAAPSR